MKKKSLFEKKYIRIICLFVLLFAVLILLSKIGNNPVQKIASDVMSPVYSACENVITPTRRFVSHIKNANKYEDEIENLKRRNIELEKANRSREEYINENKRLKELLDLREGMQNTKTVTARVVSYEPNSWYDTVTINKGSNSNIKVDDAVITGLGLVGKVTEVGKNWARVSTILNIGNSVGAKLSRTGDLGIISGDAVLAENKKCKLEYLSNEKNVITGDVLLTSGFGGVYPSDLMIGRIDKIISDSSGNMEYATVTPSVDFSALYEVLVVTYSEENTITEGED